MKLRKYERSTMEEILAELDMTQAEASTYKHKTTYIVTSLEIPCTLTICRYANIAYLQVMITAQDNTHTWAQVAALEVTEHMTDLYIMCKSEKLLAECKDVPATSKYVWDVAP